MNIQQLRQSLKMKWLSYYQENRSWLVKMRIWATYEGLRRPSSGFILATLSVLEPEFDQTLAFISDLNNNPDQIIVALGLNFSPDEELSLISAESLTIANSIIDDTSLETYTENVCEKSVVINPVATVASSIPMPESSVVQDFVYQESFVSSATYVHEHFPGDRQLVASVAVDTRDNSDRQPVSSVAIATHIKPEPLTKLLLTDQPPSESPPPETSSLVMPYEVPLAPKTLPALAHREVVHNGQSLPSMTVAVKVPNNGKQGKIQIKNLAYKTKPPSTNARSLASWVDEFCQGSKWDAKEAIFMEF